MLVLLAPVSLAGMQQCTPPAWLHMARPYMGYAQRVSLMLLYSFALALQECRC